VPGSDGRGERRGAREKLPWRFKERDGGRDRDPVGTSDEAEFDRKNQSGQKGREFPRVKQGESAFGRV